MKKNLKVKKKGRKLTLEKFEEFAEQTSRRFVEIDKRFDEVDKRFDEQLTRFLNYVDFRFHQFRKEMRSEFFTKDDFNKFMIKMDKHIKRANELDQQRILLDRRLLEMDERIHNHETRIIVVEKEIIHS